ncbi:MAG: peptide ABC transporter substrate-binding protein [Gammaproteobacteria bacterium RBG_16_57_12]|nr:MAG: peptide ABC transporter substrate-binding protein [Gammaproteobacteria bacterium RBG_16_57_12]
MTPRAGILPRLLIVLLALCLISCSKPEADVLRFGLSSAPVTLDPRFATDATSERINRLLYDRLVDFNEASQPVPALAHWQPLSPTHYRFTLDAGRRPFHHGRALTAQDVRATYEFILLADNGSPHRSSLSLIEHIETPDPQTVDFHLSRPDPLFPGYLVIGILPAELMAKKHPFNSEPVGSGPFRFVAWPEEGRLQLVRGVDRQAFEFLRVMDPTVRSLKLIRGEIDMLENNLPPELITYLEGIKTLTVERHPGSNFSYLGFNMQDPVVGRREVRQAIAHALDRDAIIRYVLGGAAHPATSILPPQHWAGDPDLPLYAYDPARARQLLGQVVVNGQPLHITYKTSNDPFRVRLATIIQQQLAEVGIEVDLRSYDWGTFYGDIKNGHFQMFSLAWVGIKTPDIFRYAFHGASVPPNGANRGRYTNQAVDSLLDAIQNQQDLTELASNYRALQQLINEDLPYVPLWYEDHVFIARQGIHGYEISADGNYDGLITVRRY